MQAVSRSPRLEIESFRIKEASEALTQAKAESKPSLDFVSQLGGRQSNTNFNFNNNSTNDLNLSRSVELDLSMPIYEGGRLKAQRESAKVGIDTAQANYLVAKGDIVQRTAIAYLDVVRDRKIVDIYRRNVALLEAQKSTSAALLEHGENTISDQALIESRLASIRIELEQSIATLRGSESRYKTLVGSPAPQAMPVPQFDLPSSIQEVTRFAQRNNAELQSLRTQVEAGQHNIKVAKAGSKPKLALQGVLRGAEGQSDTVRRNTAAEVLLNLRVPIMSGGANKSRVRQAHLEQNRLMLQVHDAYETMNERAEQLWANLEAAKSSQKLNHDQVKFADLALNAINEQREAGLATILDVLTVEQTLLNAHIQNVRAENNAATNTVQLLNLMGLYSR